MIPPVPGLYIVTLNNAEPLPVNPVRPEGERQPIRVNLDHCKFGRAENLRRRAEDYQRTFGPNNIKFIPIAHLPVLGELLRAEATVLEALKRHRIRGATNRANEWLEGISAIEVEQIVIELLGALGVRFERLGTEINALPEGSGQEASLLEPWPPPPIPTFSPLFPITSWAEMHAETLATGVEFDNFWLESVDAGVAYFFRWLGEPRATVLAIWEGRNLTLVEYRGVGDRDLKPEESLGIVEAVHQAFRNAAFGVGTGTLPVGKLT